MRRTKQKSIDPGKTARKREAVRSVVLQGLLQMLTIGLALYLRSVVRSGWLRALLLLLALGDGISLPFMWVVLRQRLNEIEGGEIDAARKY